MSRGRERVAKEHEKGTHGAEMGERDGGGRGEGRGNGTRKIGERSAEGENENG